MSAHTVLSIGAHPDDIEIGCGGYEILLRARGYQIVHAIVTDGGEGSQRYTSAELIPRRKEEARASAKIIGADEVVFFNQKESETFSHEFKPALIKLIRRVRPQIVFTHASAETMGDHRRVHEAVIDAVAIAAGPWYRECGPSHSTTTVLGFEVWAPLPEPALAVNISDAIEQKCQALACHRTQLEEIGYVEAVKGLGRYRGVMLQKGGAAEAFEVIRTVDGYAPNR